MSDTISKTITDLQQAGLELFPLGNHSKTPRDKGWQLRDYSNFDFKTWVKQGGNIGVRARACDLIVDVDPRNGGDVSLEALLWDLDIPSLDAFPLVRTGSGGRHIYMQVPEGQRWRHNIKNYPGLDFQTFGRYVVAPGSIHPDTGEPYVLERAFASEVPNAPEALLDKLCKPPRTERSGDGGEISCAQLAELLSVLDPGDYGQGGKYHDEWLDLAMACHDATNGDGHEEWLEWCAGDPRYGDDARNINAARWDSFESGHSGGVTYKTLLQAVTRTGKDGKGLVADLDRVSAAEDFDDEFGGESAKKPIIKMSEARLTQVLDEAIAALRSTEANVYQINGRLVQMLRHNNFVDDDCTEESEFEQDTRRPDGSLIIGRVEAKYLLEILMGVAQWAKFDARSKKWNESAPPEKYANHILARPEWKLSILRGSIEAPTLRANGKVLQTPGYDRRAQLFFDDGAVTFPPIPDTPTREQAIEALALLKNVIREFPFVPDKGGKPGGVSASRSVALSAMLTALVRRTLGNAPAHAFDAPAAGTGKTKLAEIAAALPIGRKPTMVSQGSTVEEFNKRLFAVLLSGDQVVTIDNIEQEIASDELCSALTSPSMQGRILGKSEMATVPTNVLVMFTGNNMTFRGDITDRVVIARLDAGIEDPKSREFDWEPVSHALENRPALVAAGLTVLRAHVVAGYPGQAMLKSPSRMPDWDRVVRSALVWLGEPDPQSTVGSLVESDPEREDLQALMRAWEDAIGLGKLVNAKDIIGRATADFPDDTDEENYAVSLGDALDNLPERRGQSSRALGRYLSSVHNRIVGGMSIHMKADDKRGSTYWLERVDDY